MGASGIEKEIMQQKKDFNSRQFFSAYKHIKNILGNIYIENNKPIDVYLINSKTIKDFLLTLGNIFEIKNEEELNKKEEELKKTFEDYIIKDKNVEIFSNYDQSKKIMNDKDENEFIIVDKTFTSILKINSDYKKVEINKIENKYLSIKFLSSGKIINAQEIENKKGFFKFCEKKEDKINPNPILSNENKNEKIITNVNSMKQNNDKDSLIKNIFYCLIKINSLNNFFLCCGDMLKEKNNFSSKFFNLIDTYNINGQIDCSKLYDFIEEKNKKDIESIIQFSYEQMHNDLKDLYKNKGSIINDIFNYQFDFLCKCQNNIYENNYIIKFSLKDIYSYRNSQNLNIYDCFEYLFSNKNNSCPKCGNNYLKKINYVNDILTIIFEIEKDTRNILFDLNFNLKLDKYTLENSQNKYNFDLIIFSVYSNEEGKFISYHKDYDKTWNYYDGTKEKQNQIVNEINYKNPVLLIYKNNI